MHPKCECVEGTDVPFVVEYILIMIATELVKAIVSEYFETEENFYLVDLKITPDNRIMIEIDTFEGVSLDDCVKLHRFIESKIDREVEDYELEVSSAGISEPFKVIQQYEKNIDNEVEILLKDGKKISGLLIAVFPEQIKLEVEKSVKLEGAKRKSIITEEIEINLTDIKTTKLIIHFK